MSKHCLNCKYLENGGCTCERLCIGFSEWALKDTYNVRREQMAIAAMQGLLSVSDWSYEKIVADAVIIADKLIKELDK